MMGGANILCSKPVTIKHTGFRLTGYWTKGRGSLTRDQVRVRIRVRVRVSSALVH